MHDELVWVLGTRIFSDHERSFFLRIVGKWAYASLFGGPTDPLGLGRYLIVFRAWDYGMGLG